MQTVRDAEIAEWIGRIGAAGAEHVMGRFWHGPQLGYARLSLLVKDRLLGRGRCCIAGRGCIWRPRRGCAGRACSVSGSIGSARAGFSTPSRSPGRRSRCTGRCRIGATWASVRSACGRAIGASRSPRREWGSCPVAAVAAPPGPGVDFP